jgi:hypothetical protein
MIKDITVSVGGQILQKFSGSYLLSMMQRDYPVEKRDLYDQMTGNVPELNDPGCCGARVNQYPNAYYTPSARGAEPSIRGRKIYIPINTWFTTSSQMAFPLVCLQYNTLQIDVTLRPVKELYVIRDVTDPDNEWPYVQSNYTLNEHQFYRFLQTPPDVELGPSSYTDTRTDWNADVFDKRHIRVGIQGRDGKHARQTGKHTRHGFQLDVLFPSQRRIFAQRMEQLHQLAVRLLAARH